ncbi:MAG: RAMP superfamily CRISPR-associated protein [Thermoprotei archaeon]|jgi:CRISPR/Cas system CSM-associated protein Csm3 (group 7 of RAMP superfamily)
MKVAFITTKKFHTSSNIPIKTRADNLLMETVNNHGKFVKLIPASTLKGVLRTSLIRISKALGYDNTVPSIQPEKIRNHKDIVTLIFGKPGEDFSKITIENAYYTGETYTLVHIRIDDERGIVKEEGLYSAEYIPAGERFSTKIKCTDFSIEEVRALLAALVNLRYENIGKDSFTFVKIEEITPKEIIEELKKDEITSLLLKALIEEDKK